MMMMTFEQWNAQKKLTWSLNPYILLSSFLLVQNTCSRANSFKYTNCYCRLPVIQNTPELCDQNSPELPQLSQIPQNGFCLLRGKHKLKFEGQAEKWQSCSLSVFECFIFLTQSWSNTYVIIYFSYTVLSSFIFDKTTSS